MRLSRRPAAPLTLAPALLVALAGCGPRLAEGERYAFEPDSIPEAYAQSTAALMWPGATRAFQIDPAGNLYNGAWVVRIDPRAGDRAASAPRVIAYEERWRPIAH